MTFYSHIPAALYAYTPVPFPNQEFYAMYPSGSPDPSTQTLFYESVPPTTGGPKYYSKGSIRKDSADSGISTYSGGSRKISSTSTLSQNSIPEESFKEQHESTDSDENETPYVEPDDDLCEKIVAQVEFYFSDANITKDKFLLKHVKRNKEGFVSLKLISSFKRVKHLSKDWRQVAEAIQRKSDKLEVNDLKTKVRRLADLPEYDETTPSRTVVALNLPLERPTIEGVAEIFSKVGDIVLIRILRPGNPIPADIKPFVNKHPEMTAKVCALVEFERTEFAMRSVRELNDDAEDKMQVMELIPPPSKTKAKKLNEKKFGDNKLGVPSTGNVRRSSYAGQHVNFSQQNSSSASHPPRRRISLYHNMKFEEMNHGHNNKQGLNPNAPTFTMHQPQIHHLHHHQQQRRISRPPFIHPLEVMQIQHQQLMAHTGQHPGPWMSHRRMFGEVATSGLTLPHNVLRMPRGPTKGTKGFNNWCRSRMSTETSPSVTAASTAKKSHAVPIVAPPVVEEPAKEEEEAEATPAPSAPPAEAAEPAVEQPQPQHPANPIIVINGDDSGNEDECFSDPEQQDAAPVIVAENEKSR